MVLIALFSIPSERRLCEQLRYNLLFRWFLDMDMDMVEEPFDHCAFSDNGERLMTHDVARKFFGHVFDEAKALGLASSDHFSVDGTPIEAWASMKSFRPKDEDEGDNDGNGWADFKGSKRSNKTHASKTDPEAKLKQKGPGKEAKLAFEVHALMENRNGLVVDVRVTEANGTSETEAALQMLNALPHRSRRRTVGADKGYDSRAFVEGCRSAGFTPHVAQREKGKGRRGSAINGTTTRHPGYTASQRVRNRVEQLFGWGKCSASLRKTRFRGVDRTSLSSTMIYAAYNSLRIGRLSSLPT